MPGPRPELVSDIRTRAAIHRASQQARNAMQQLDRQTIADLVEIYTDAAEQVRGEIRAAATAGDLVPLQHLQQLLGQVEAILGRLAERRNDMLLRGIDEAAALGVRPYTLQGVAATGIDGQALLTSTAAMRVHEEAVRFVREFQAADGLTLSRRLWRVDAGARETLSRAITRAVVQGADASRAAAQAVYSGVAVPADVAQRMAAAQSGQLVRVADLLAGSSTDPAVPMANAQRVLRTEINRAHGEAYMAGGEGVPNAAGWRFLLSPLHPRPDICDLYALQNLHGLGQGVYPTRQACPWPAHPNTLSFVVMVFAEEVTDATRAGRETTLQALQRMAPEMRASVLGQTKAEYFDQGLLGTGMVRSTLRAVEQRLERKGDMPQVGA